MVVNQLRKHLWERPQTYVRSEVNSCMWDATWLHDVIPAGLRSAATTYISVRDGSSTRAGDRFGVITLNKAKRAVQNSTYILSLHPALELTVDSSYVTNQPCLSVFELCTDHFKQQWSLWS